MDINHFWGDDLSLNDTGDLAIADGTLRGQQRVLRRLMTCLQQYVWHLDYGAGVPKFIGELLDVPLITSVIRNQMSLEEAVDQSTAPAITIKPSTDGIFCRIVYADATTQTVQVLNFEVTP